MDSSQELSPPNDLDRNLRDEIRIAKPILDKHNSHAINLMRKRFSEQNINLNWEDALKVATVEALAIVLNNPTLRNIIDISEFSSFYRLYRSLELHFGEKRGKEILFATYGPFAKNIINHFYALFIAPPTNDQVSQLFEDNKVQYYRLDQKPTEIQLIEGQAYLFKPGKPIEGLPERIKTAGTIDDLRKLLPKQINHLVVLYHEDKSINVSKEGRNLLRGLYSSMEELVGYIHLAYPTRSEFLLGGNIKSLEIVKGQAFGRDIKIAKNRLS